MARLARRAVKIPEGLKVEVSGDKVTVTGKKGKLEAPVFPNLSVVVEKEGVFVRNEVPSEQRKLFRKTDGLQGLLRSLIENMITGLTDGFSKTLEIHGVGYRAEAKGKELHLNLGFSNPVIMEIPEGIELEIVRNTVVFVRGMDRQKVGAFAAKMRALYPPEPYKGKGIRYRGEAVRHKVGKSAVGAAQ